MLFTLSFFIPKIKSHIRPLDNFLLQCERKGGLTYAGEDSLPYIHSPLVAGHFSVNSLPLTAAVNGFVRKSFIVFSTVL